MTIIAFKDGHTEIFQEDGGKVEHEGGKRWCINGQSGVTADWVFHLPN